MLIVQWVSSWASSLFYSPSSRAPADGENSYIAGFVHIGQEPGDGNVADGLFEEHLLYGGRADRAEGRQQQEELTKTTRLSRVPETQLVSKTAFLSGSICRLSVAACPITAHL